MFSNFSSPPWNLVIYSSGEPCRVYCHLFLFSQNDSQGSSKLLKSVSVDTHARQRPFNSHNRFSHFGNHERYSFLFRKSKIKCYHNGLSEQKRNTPQKANENSTLKQATTWSAGKRKRLSRGWFFRLHLIGWAKDTSFKEVLLNQWNPPLLATQLKIALSKKVLKVPQIL